MTNFQGPYKTVMDICSDGKLHRYLEFREANAKRAGVYAQDGIMTYVKTLVDKGHLVKYGRGVYGVPDIKVPDGADLSVAAWNMNGKSFPDFD